MSNIYSVKYMHETSTTLESKVFKKSVNETYLFSNMNILHEMNNIIDNNTKKMYLQINEAESKEDENKIFAEYFYQFKSVFENYSNKLRELKSRMVIAIENKVETWEDLFKDDEYISHFDKQFSYSGYNFLHMDDSNYPRLHLQKYYQKEFDYIAQLMQDTTMNASPSVRLKIIATVCNNFAKCSGDKNWIKELIQDMVDIDEKEITRSYSECVYNALRDKYDINVDKGMLYTCKENLSDYEDVINAASILCDNLLCDLDKVAENISSFLFRNQDNKLKIKTDTDGIIDRDYRLDTYSMNQLNLFMKNKISQIKKLLNVYSIAIGIKFDTAVDFIDQNIEILKMAKTYDANEPGSEEDEEDNNTIDNVENPESTNPEDNDEPDSNDEPSPENSDDDDDFKFGEEDSDNKEPIEEEPDELGSLDDNNEEEPMNNEPIDGESGDFEEAYLFESELFELELMAEEYNMHNAITEVLLLELDQMSPPPVSPNTSQNGGNTTQTQQNQNSSEGNNNQNNQSNTSNVRKLANQEKDPNFLQKIIAKIKELWERFRKRFFDNTKEKIEYLKKNKASIAKQVTGEAGLKYTPNFALIDQLNIPDLNYPTMKNELDDEDQFCANHFGKFYKKGQSETITDSIKSTILGEDQPLADVKTLKTNIQDAYNFCINYEKTVNSINSAINILDKAEKVARRDISKVEDGTPKTELAYMRDHNYYFMEFEGDKVGVNTEKTDNVKTYFNVCSRVLAAKMTVCNNLFAEMYAYCNWWITRAKGGFVPGNEKQQKSETPTEGNK